MKNKTNRNFTIHSKEDNNKISLKTKIHKIILYALQSLFFSEFSDKKYISTSHKIILYVLQSLIFSKFGREKYFLTIPKVNAEIPHAILCRIYGIENDILNTENLTKFFWKYYLQLYLLYKYLCYPNNVFDDLCILFYGRQLYESKIQNGDTSRKLPQHLLVSPEDFDLLLHVVEIIGYDDYHLSIIWLNAPLDYASRISPIVSNKLLEFVQRLIILRLP